MLVKWENIEPEQGVFDFGPADEIVHFAQSIGAQMRGHNFEWYVIPNSMRTFTYADPTGGISYHHG